MFSRTCEYALRAAVTMAGQDGLPLLSLQIAARTGVRNAYMQKVLRLLVRSRLAASRRGPGGGFVLARPALEISVLDVINAVDPIHRIESCPLKNAQHAVELCPLHRRIDQAIARTRSMLGATTLAQLAAEERPSSCENRAAR